MSASSNTPEQGERRGYWIEAGHALHLEGRLPEDEYLDRVTGCHNKHYLLEILEPQIAVAQQCGFPLSLVLVEIAQMHRIRYTSGNLATNGMLKGFADIIRKTVRSTDLIVRYADDIFAIVCLHATQFGASRACDRMRLNISHHAFPSEKGDQIVVANFGVAEQGGECDPHGRTLILSAEESLHQANLIGDYAIVRYADLKGSPAATE
jgi:diguanylate cyclase (GGDEF)-like protein